VEGGTRAGRASPHLNNTKKRKLDHSYTNPHNTQAVGPSEVLHTLLRNLRVQERQNRVCTTVAIAIVAGASLFTYMYLACVYVCQWIDL
jgi:hypothetical protein